MWNLSTSIFFDSKEMVVPTSITKREPRKMLKIRSVIHDNVK